MGKILFIWVEGGSDARFFHAVFKPLFERSYRRVEIRAYANLKRDKFEKILQGLQAIDADYLVVADIDRETCVTAKKKYVQSRIRVVPPELIRVVIEEIESWYLAGMDETLAQSLGVALPERTDTITKEDFIALMPESFDSRIDFMMEVLKSFSPAQAEKKNASFRYFVAKHRLELESTAPPEAAGTEFGVPGFQLKKKMADGGSF